MKARSAAIAILNGLLLGAIVCDGDVRANGTGEKGFALLVTVPQGAFHTNEAITGTIAVVNKSAQSIVIVKPQLPSAWSVRYFGTGSGEQPLASWEGSVLRGTTDPGHPRRYQPDQYETIPGGQTFAKPLDLRWFIRNQRDSFPEGCYGVKFWYRYAPDRSEADLPLLPTDLSAEEVRICVTKPE
jgi:hypothetical protein